VLPACVLLFAKPSDIALGCIILSLAYQGKMCYPTSLQQIAGISSDSFSHIVKQLHIELKSETEKHVTRNSTVVKKYSIDDTNTSEYLTPRVFMSCLSIMLSGVWGFLEFTVLPLLLTQEQESLNFNGIGRQRSSANEEISKETYQTV